MLDATFTERLEGLRVQGPARVLTSAAALSILSEFAREGPLGGLSRLHIAFDLSR